MQVTVITRIPGTIFPQRIRVIQDYFSLTHCGRIDRDRVPTVLLHEWELLCNLFDGDVVSGPVPTLFSERPDAARAALEADPEKASQDLSRVLRKFVIPENVPPAAAWGVLLKPR